MESQPLGVPVTCRPRLEPGAIVVYSALSSYRCLTASASSRDLSKSIKPQWYSFRAGAPWRKILVSLREDPKGEWKLAARWGTHRLDASSVELYDEQIMLLLKSRPKIHRPERAATRVWDTPTSNRGKVASHSPSPCEAIIFVSRACDFSTLSKRDASWGK